MAGRLAVALGVLSVGSTTAIAADLGLPPRPYAPAYYHPAVVYDWTGFYIGGSAGGGFGLGGINNNIGSVFCNLNLVGCNPNQASAAAVAAVPSGFDTKPSGFIGGGQIGYNYQMGWFVWGVEADFSGTDIKGSNSKTLSATVVDTVTSTTIVNTISGTGNQKLNWLGTGRARVGVVPFTPLLVYATGGVAYGNVSSEVSFTQSYNFNCFCGPNPTTGASISTTQWGWTAGGGVEWLFAPHWSVRAEFLYYNLGHVSVNTTLTQLNGAGVPFTTVGITSTADAKGDIVRGGINYKF